MPPSVALRTALIWNDEVMGDFVSHEPRTIALGSTGRTTFTIPQLGLPETLLPKDVEVGGIKQGRAFFLALGGIIGLALGVIPAVIVYLLARLRNRAYGYAIIRPGNRGYVLTLSSAMRGTISVDGTERSVADFVRHGDVAQSGFHATPISGRDWGVIELDDSGRYKLFFQFVPIEDQRSLLVPLILAGLIGWLVVGLAMTTVIALSYDIEFTDALFNGMALAGINIGLLAIIAGLIYWYVICDMEMQLSHVISFVVHGALLFFGWRAYLHSDRTDPYVWPGDKSMTGNYLVTRLEPEPPPEPPKVAAAAPAKQEAAPKNENKTKKNTATENDAGNSGGKGDTERARTKHPNNDKPAPPKVAVMEDKNRRILDNIVDKNLTTDLTKFAGIQSDETKRGSIGFGKSDRGTGVGDHCRKGMPCSGTRDDSNGNGTGGGGKVKGDFVSSGKIDTGKERAGGNCVGDGCKGNAPKEVKVGIAAPSGDFSGLTAEEIDRVVRSKAGLYKACYQKELNHSPGIGGKMVVHFVINGEGHVTSANGGGLGNADVESCVVRNIRSLVFPAKGGTANVNYPFVFSQGG